MSNPYRPDQDGSYQDGSYRGGSSHDAPPSVQDAPAYGSPSGPPHAPSASPYQASPFQASPYGPSPYATQPYPVQNQLALIAFICSLAGLVTGLSAVAGIVCGHIALGQLRSNPQQTGRGFAVAALWIGYVLVAVIVAYFVFLLTFLAAFWQY
ncbi:DUF4190 domain-containing protein [Litorihabitans aurantiacus]|uniref:Membrane protein n=1 Tax=Litorihabitans aurantiacus TaxID=1930061 RepID=A0AA37XCI3_9MICO|nr:DUF4190 domain-containing protein [Litorihabitans aurantiacus]GMA30091.1 membrane protein [Litorihabitans aurantiacus]